jgi:hypothetical protein
VSQEPLLYPFDAETRTWWKSYPVRVRGPRPSRCCQAASLLVRSPQGGYVSASCSQCGARGSISEGDFRGLGLWVGCPKCRRAMKAMLLSGVRRAGNYGFSCEHCRVYVRLADLPDWRDVVPVV